MALPESLMCMDKEVINRPNPKQYNPLVLAYMGDAMYEVLVREYLILNECATVNKLHTQAVKFVCAAAQSKFMEALLPLLTEDEMQVFKRGRNNNSSTVPKNANVQEYRRATGFEALVGYLYLSGEKERLHEFFDIIISLSE